MPLLFDPKKIVIQIEIDKATARTTMETSEEVPYPVVVDTFCTLLSETTRSFMAQAMKQQGQALAGIALPPGVRGPSKIS